MICVTGSAPYIVEHLPSINQKYPNIPIIAVGNSWKIAINYNLIRWYKAGDFNTAGTYTDITNIPETKKEIMHANLGFCREVQNLYLDFNSNKNGTMMINVLLQLYWEHIQDKTKLDVIVTGSDFIYDGAEYKNNSTHFYGNGTADPYRFGKEWLVAELDNLYKLYKDANFMIFNSSPLNKTMLPFPRI